MVVLAALSGCGSSAGVHTTRADPIGATPETSEQPTDTSVVGTDSLDWGSCDDPSAQDPALQCATLTVPLDYDAPIGDTIDLALVRVPASGNRHGAVLFNPGGPGASGFDFIAFSGSGMASALGLDSFDLIGFDPRGVDRSDGIHCVSDEFVDQHLYVDSTPDTPEEQVLNDEADTAFIDGCKQKYGDTLRFFSTENTARDVDAIRAGLGDDQISFLGASYGTYLGAAYASMFPDRVRAMVLASAYEPVGDTVEQQFATQLVGFEDAFNQWATWCENEPACAFATPDVGARWDALLQRLDDTPIAGTDGRAANNATMERATKAALYLESDWPVLAAALAKAENGDPSGIFSIADSYNGRNADGTFSTLIQSFPVIRCASGLNPGSPPDPEALLATLRAAAPRFGKSITTDDLTSESDDCRKLVGQASPIEVSYAGDGPIVVVGGVDDPATPIRWAEKMTGELGPNARMVTYTGAGHGQLLVGSCVSDIEGAVLTDLQLPPPDTICDPDPIVGRPDWWDSLPVPDGVSDVAALPGLAGIVTDPTQLFSEMRTTSLSADDAIAAYNDAMAGAGFQQFDTPAALPMDDVSQSGYVDFSGRALLVVALGPKAFDDKALQSAKSEVPADTTVVWLIAVPI